MGYDVGSKFARGGSSAAAATLVGFGLTTDSMEATHCDHLKCCCNDASYIPFHPQQRLVHELETNGRNDKEERHSELLLYQGKKAFLLFNLHRRQGRNC